MSFGVRSRPGGVGVHSLKVMATKVALEDPPAQTIDSVPVNYDTANACLKSLPRRDSTLEQAADVELRSAASP